MSSDTPAPAPPHAPTRPAAPRLFLVDGYALIYRAFFALGQQPLRNARGENTSIAKGVHDFLKRLLEKHRPEHLGWVHDAGLSFRHEVYPAYKATRERLEPELQADFDTGVERVTELLAAYRVPLLSLDGYEADDVIGTLAHQAAAQGLNAVIVSGDKDFVQLVRPGVWILNPWHGRPGQTTEKWYDEVTAPERLGVPATHVTDYLALVGDTSDNVPGVKGIGEKGAQALIQRWGSLESLLAHVEEVEPTRARNALREHAQAARLSKQLVTIRDDLPMVLDAEALRVREPDWATLQRLFVTLDMHTAARDAAARAAGGGAAGVAGAAGAANAANASATPDGGAVGSSGPVGVETRPDAAEAPVPVAYRTVTTVEEVEALVRRAREVAYVAVDTETVLEPDAPPGIVTPLRAQLVGVSLAVAPGEAFYLPLAHRAWGGAQGDLLGDRNPPPGESVAARALAVALAQGAPPPANLPPLDHPAMRPLRELLEDAAVPKAAHHTKYDLLVLRRAGVTLRGVDFDSMLASYVLDPGRRSHALDALALDHLGMRMTRYEELCGKGKQQLPFDVVPLAEATAYAAADADVTWRLRARFAPQLAEHAAAPLLQEIELPLVAVLADMEWTGVTIDLPWFHQLKERFAREREAVEARIHAVAGEPFNVASNKQLAAILFGKLGLPVRKKTATGPSTDASVLQELADEGHELPALLLEYRELAKLENTYLDTLPALVNPHTGRLHTTFSQTVAATGRLSSHDPNLQNIPVRRELGKAIRKGFIPRAGWEFVTADYSQIELRLLAHLSHDPAFVEAFRAGGDIHRQTASVIFDVPVADVTGEMRARAKTINFATIYGQGAFALARQLGIAQAEAKAFIATYFERFAGVRAYLDAQVAGARERGYVETIFHRRRYIPELQDRNFNVRAFGERLAQNSPIQGSAADLIKVAMLRVQARLAESGMAARMLLQVHDELVFECPPGELEALTALVRREMEAAVALDVPLVVDVGHGPDWLAAKE